VQLSVLLVPHAQRDRTFGHGPDRQIHRKGQVRGYFRLCSV